MSQQRRRFIICAAHVLLVVALATCGLAHAVQPRDSFTTDGNFSFCEDRDLDQCRLLTGAFLAGPRFNADERRLLMTLKSFAAYADTAVADVKLALGPWRLITQIPDRAHDSRGISWELEPSICPTPVTAYCTLDMVFRDDQLTSMRVQTPSYFVQWFVPVPTVR